MTATKAFKFNMGAVSKRTYKKRRERWYTALLSGKYEQGGGALLDFSYVWDTDASGAEVGPPVGITNVKYCCLGVGGVCAGIPHGPDNLSYGVTEKRGFLSIQREEYPDAPKYFVTNGSASDEIATWLGLKNISGSWYGPRYDGTYDSLVSMNDGGVSWTDIVAWCRTTPPGLWMEGTF